MNDKFIDDYLKKAEEFGLTKEDLNPNGPIVFDDDAPPGLKSTIEYVSKETPEKVYLRLHIRGKNDCSAGKKFALRSKIAGWEYFVDQKYELYLRNSENELLFGVKIYCGKIIEVMPRLLEKIGTDVLFKSGDDCKLVVGWVLGNYSALRNGNALLSQRK